MYLNKQKLKSMETVQAAKKLHFQIKSAHRSDEVLEFETAVVPNYQKINDLCQSFFGFDGYLVITWSDGTKVCTNQPMYERYSKYLPNNDKIFYLETNCVKK